MLVASIGCGRDGPAPSGGARPDTLILATPADAITLDPHNANDVQSDQVIAMVHAGLVKFDVRLNIVGNLAEEWSLSPDGKVWSFRLRSGLHFDDGTPIDAAAVKASFTHLLDPALKNVGASLFAMIDRIEVADQRTVRFVTAYPFRAFERTMAHVSGSILDVRALERYGKSFGRSAQTTSGVGPYRVARWIRDHEIVLERNANYWGPKPPTGTIVYRMVPEPAARALALEVDDVDVITNVLPSDLKRLASMPTLQVIRTPSIVGRVFMFNCRRWPYTDRRVRQAIIYAIDRRPIADMFSGFAAVSRGPLTPPVDGYVDLGEIPFDPQRARALLAEAGLAGGFKTGVWTTRRYTFGVEMAEAVAAQLRRVGIQASIEVVEPGTYISRYRGVPPEDNPMEIFILGIAARTAEADWSLRPHFLTQPTNENNYGYYSNAEFDDVIVRAMRENDTGMRKTLYRRAQEIVYLEDPAAAWLNDQDYAVAARRAVMDLTVSPLGIVTLEKATR